MMHAPLQEADREDSNALATHAHAAGAAAALEGPHIAFLEPFKVRTSSYHEEMASGCT